MNRKYIIVFGVLLTLGFAHFYLNNHNLFGFLLHKGFGFGDKDKHFINIHWRAYPKANADEDSLQLNPHHSKKKLLPESCGTCHFKAYKEWKQTGHVHSINSNIELLKLRNINVQGCMPCHAPLLEQKEQLQPGVINPVFNKELYKSGVSCTVCHIRDSKVIGTLRVKEGVQDPNFCVSCHQGDETVGIKLVGPRVFNVHQEWLKTPSPKNNQTCQHCHMKDGTHLIMGLKNPEWVEGYLDSELSEVSTGTYKYTLKNSKNGHSFPSALGAKATLVIEALDSKGEILNSKSFVVQKAMDKKLTLLFNTRLDFGESASVDLTVHDLKDSAKIRAYTVIDRDHFRQLLFAKPEYPESELEITLREKAYKRTLDNSYRVFLQERSIMR